MIFKNIGHVTTATLQHTNTDMDEDGNGDKHKQANECANECKHECTNHKHVDGDRDQCANKCANEDEHVDRYEEGKRTTTDANMDKHKHKQGQVQRRT